MALRSLRGECVPHVLLAGALTGHVHGYGLGTNLLAGRHPAPGTNLLLTVSKCPSYKLALTAYCKTRLPGQHIATQACIDSRLQKRDESQWKCCDAGDIALLPLAEEALRKVHRCSILVNDLHPDNVVLVADGNMARVFFIDFSHSTPLPTLAQCAEELCSLRDVFSLKAE